MNRQKDVDKLVRRLIRREQGLVERVFRAPLPAVSVNPGALAREVQRRMKAAGVALPEGD